MGVHGCWWFDGVGCGLGGVFNEGYEYIGYERGKGKVVGFLREKMD